MGDSGIVDFRQQRAKSKGRGTETKTMKRKAGYVLLMMFTGLLLGGCQRKEPLEPPYDTTALVVVSNRDYAPLLLSSITGAGESIHVIMYLMKHYPEDSLNGVSQLQDALIAAAQTNTDVKVILEKSDYNSSLNASNGSTFVYLDSMGLDVRFDPPSVTTHAKLVIVDGKTVFLGSSNWTRSALEDNNEMNVKIQDPDIAGAMETYFQELWSLSSQ
jgi:phosphatidylserine/phosphatidylglycerophosphate/cardiolipin synthase-like enzyme